MECYTKEQHVIIVKIYYKYGESYAETVCKLHEIFGRQNAPYHPTVKKEWLRNLRKQVRLWTVKYLCVVLPAGLATTLPQWVKVLLRAQEHRFAIVHNNWTFREAPCSKFSRKICICMLARFNWRKNSSQQTMCIAENLLIGCWKTKKWMAIFRRKSSLAMRHTFNLMGKWTQNCQIWSAENPPVIHEKPLHAQQATVWCGFWAGGVIGPYFFENEAGNGVTVNAVCYRNMVTEFLWPQLDGMDMDMSFQ